MIRSRAIRCLFAACLLPLSAFATEPRTSFVFENDMMGMPKSDENYTMGIVVTHSRFGFDETGTLASIYQGLGTFNRLIAVDRAGPSQASRTFWTFGSTNFTPTDITNPEPIPDDRPYASLLYYGVGYNNLRDDGWEVSTEFQLAVLGTQVGEKVQSEIHRHCCPDRIPEGWGNQIGNGGSLTFLYGARWTKHLWESPRHQLLGTIGGEVGYYTRALAGLALAFGATPADLRNVRLSGLSTAPRPWIHVPAELKPASADAQEQATASAPSAGFSFWIDYEVSAFAYNELLQGAWSGENKVTFSRSELRPVVQRVNSGVELTFIPKLLGMPASWDIQLYLTQSWKSREIKTSKGKDHHWGGLTLAWGL